MAAKKEFENPFAGIEDQQARREARQATGRAHAYHGRYYQLTTRLPEELVEEVRGWAARLQMTQQDLQRWFFYRGIMALGRGERPETEEVVERKLKIPTTGE